MAQIGAVSLQISASQQRRFDRLMKAVGNEAMWAEKSALRSVGGKCRTEYIRRMASKLQINQPAIRRRTKTFPTDFDKRKKEVAQRVWVGTKRPITEKDDPKVLANVVARSSPFKATMKSGHTGMFVRTDSWRETHRNSYRRLSRHYFKRPDGQNTYLPIVTPKILLSTDESKRTLINACDGMMTSLYPTRLRKELVTRIKRLRKGQARRR